MRYNKLILRMFCASLLCFCAIFLCPVRSNACAIPVFRYALEQWMPDAYSVQVYHRGPLDPANQAALSILPGSAGEAPLAVNLRLQLRSRDLPPDLEPFLSRGAVLSIHYPGRLPSESPLWIGPLSETIVQRIVRSPSRTTIADRILSGETAVFLYLRTGDVDLDERSYAQLEEALRNAEHTLDLQGFAEAAGKDPEELVPPDAPPLKIAFSALSIARRDPEEMFLLTPVLRAYPELLAQDAPAVVPVFARGRALPPLAGDALTPEAIQATCRFLIEACSCEVKAQNPGMDLLFASDWGGDWPPLDYEERVLPPLEGVLEAPPPPAADPVATAVPTPPPGTALPVRTLLISLAAIGVAIVVATGWLVGRNTDETEN